QLGRSRLRLRFAGLDRAPQPSPQVGLPRGIDGELERAAGARAVVYDPAAVAGAGARDEGIALRPDLAHDCLRLAHPRLGLAHVLVGPLDACGERIELRVLVERPPAAALHHIDWPRELPQCAGFAE